MKFDLKKIPCFGVAGNFTGHLEQAGEAKDFLNVQTKEVNAPKAIFPTYIPVEESKGKESENEVPAYLKKFPFDSEKIIFPEGQQNLQVESECAVICEVKWIDSADEKIIGELNPVAFGASNDCSIRKEGARKISEKKNWGASSKGLSDNLILVDSFDEKGCMNDYRIASYLIRDGKLIEYGENSAIRNYSYIYGKLNDWMIEKFNFQQNQGPAEKISDYLKAADYPEKVMVSIGATRYTDFGEHNYLENGDVSYIILYNEKNFSKEKIEEMILTDNLSDKNISVLKQCIKLKK